MQEPFPLALGTPVHLFSFADAGSQCVLLLAHRLICRAQSSQSRTSGLKSPPRPCLERRGNITYEETARDYTAVCLGVHADQSAQTKLIPRWPGWPGVGCNRLAGLVIIANFACTLGSRRFNTRDGQTNG